MDRIHLNGLWQGHCLNENGETEFSFSGNVPGCVHTDLMGTKIPADLYYRDNAEKCQWIEEKDWLYMRTFQIEQVPSRCQLVFEGLDTYAEIQLNGKVLGCTDNMFIRHSFDVSKLLRQGENQLCVLFRSPVRMVADLPARKGAFTTERLHTRRIQCTYGWDWVARFVTCGIFKDVYLTTGQGFTAEDIYIYTQQLQDKDAFICIEAAGNKSQDYSIWDPQANCVHTGRLTGGQTERICIPHAQLWYPVGYGQQPLYQLHLGNLQIPFGIRTVEIIQEEDAPGSPYHEKCLQLQDTESGRIYDHNQVFSGFKLTINGTEVFCTGANWVPCEPFPSVESDSKIQLLLDTAMEAGVNMLRVWGGGIFEKDYFYHTCDRLGILVTQDFLMACGHYPEEDPAFIAQLRQEAAHGAGRLRNHPCLVWWSGDNENAVRGSDDSTDYRGYRAIHQGLMPVMEKLDPHRPFLASSPYGGNFYASKTRGTTHNTQFLGCSLFPYVRNTEMADYKEHLSTYLARFIAEEPCFGAICRPSLEKFMTQADILDKDAMWQYHTKSNPALKFTLFDFISDFAQKVLGPYQDGADRYFKLKYIQYEWVRISMENARRNEGFISGMIYWMWNDCWPAAAGWAFVDYYGLPKAAFYSLKRGNRPLLASIDKDTLHICSRLADAPIEMTLYFLGKDGVTQLKQQSFIGSQVIDLQAGTIPAGSLIICDVQSGSHWDRAFYRHGKMPMKPCAAPAILFQTDSSVTLEAKEYIHAVELEGSFLFSNNFFSLLPGERRTISFKPAANAGGGNLQLNAYTINFEEQANETI